MSSNSLNIPERPVDVYRIIEGHGRQRHNLIPILHEVQREMGCISPESMEAIADHLGITAGQVHGTATFYTLFYTRPQGRHIVRICDSPPCHIVGSKAICNAISEHLGISPGQTTRDRSFTFETVSCMGLCGVAPAMMVNDDVYGNLTPEKVPAILNRYGEDS